MPVRLKNKFNFLMVIFFIISIITVHAQLPRLIILTDIGQDPDDQQSMVRLLHYANEFRIEGLIATADNNSENEAPVIHDEIIHKLISDYKKSEVNFNKQAKGFPTAEYLHSVVKKGNDKGGASVPLENFVGSGNDTEGSEWIIKVVDRETDQPVCVSVWGGACDLAQALWKVKNNRTHEEVDAFIQKLRVYFIGKQDASNQWIIDNFRNLWLILALDRGEDKWQSGYRGMFWGGDMSNTSKEWIYKYIHGHTALANNYPDKTYTGGVGKNPNMALKEGDTPSMLFFLPNGLNVPDHPEWGGWGGRYIPEKPHFYRDASDTFFDVSLGKEIKSPRATVYRWRNDFQNDFAARIQWGATPDFQKVNHNPVIILNGKTSINPLFINVSEKQTINLDASESSDSDGNQLSFEWLLYREAGTFKGNVLITTNQKGRAGITIPEDSRGKQFHIILRVTDSGTPRLCSYKRIIFYVQ